MLDGRGRRNVGRVCEKSSSRGYTRSFHFHEERVNEYHDLYQVRESFGTSYYLWSKPHHCRKQRDSGEWDNITGHKVTHLVELPFGLKRVPGRSQLREFPCLSVRAFISRQGQSDHVGCHDKLISLLGHHVTHLFQCDVYFSGCWFALLIDAKFMTSSDFTTPTMTPILGNLISWSFDS